MALASEIAQAKALEVPYVDWSTFMTQFKWKQSEHVLMIAPTGMGKTVLNKALLRYRERRHGYIAVLATKPVDDELTELESRGYIRVKHQKVWSAASYPKILLWPPAGDFAQSQLALQRRTFLSALQGMWKAGKWTVMLNELRYLTDNLQLKREINTLYLQARSSKLCLTGETQRPRNVPLEAFSQSSHVFFGPCRDDEDLRRISGIGNADPKVLRLVVQQLVRYQFAYVNAITGEIVVTKTKPFVKAA